MKPIAVLQHDNDVAAGTFEAWARSRGIELDTIRIDRRDSVPASSAAFSGVCSLGGPMSVNDPLPWITAELELMRDADANGVPIIGHCLGGQMLAMALGASVKRHRVKEIGWMPVEVTDAAVANNWLGNAGPQIEVFQWHGDSFEVPRGARSFLTSTLCANQAFVVERAACTHLGMQFHIEMTAELVQAWLADAAFPIELHAEQLRTGGPGVQDAATMLQDLERHCTQMAVVAEHAYDRWARSLKH